MSDSSDRLRAPGMPVGTGGSHEVTAEPVSPPAPAVRGTVASRPPGEERPVWLLDVDGVLNGTGRVGWHQPPRVGVALADGIEYRIRWAPQLVHRIRSLLADVEVRWATTWIDVGTEQLETLFGLPSLPHAYPANPPVPDRGTPDGGLRAAHLAAKTRAALNVIASGRRLIWTDDEAIPTSGRDRDILDATGALLIPPDPRRGLRPEHVDQIRTFLNDPTHQ